MADEVVTTAWVAEHLDDPNVRIVESDEDVLLYNQGHLPGAVKIDWQTAGCQSDLPPVY